MVDSEDMAVFDPHENVYGEINVQVRVTVGLDQSPDDAFLLWGLELQMKQPATMMHFVIEAPYLTSWKKWQALIHENADITLHEGDICAITHSEANLVFVTHQSRLKWTIPKAAVAPALDNALIDAIRLGLTFDHDDDDSDDDSDDDEYEPHDGSDIESSEVQAIHGMSPYLNTQ
jgi:hypothetical protein